MSNIRVKQCFEGKVTEFNITHEVRDTVPEAGIEIYFQKYVKNILQAARRGVGCFKFYVICEAYFQVGTISIKAFTAG